MKAYTITMPVTGIMVKTVEAETVEEAIEKFCDEITVNDLEQWEVHEEIVKGNVFYGVQNTMEIEEFDIED